jgi:hypothetical protein
MSTPAMIAVIKNFVIGSSPFLDRSFEILPLFWHECWFANPRLARGWIDSFLFNVDGNMYCDNCNLTQNLTSLQGAFTRPIGSKKRHRWILGPSVSSLKGLNCAASFFSCLRNWSPEVTSSYEFKLALVNPLFHCDCLSSIVSPFRFENYHPKFISGWDAEKLRSVIWYGHHLLSLRF